MATATLVPVAQYLTSEFEPDADYVDGEVEARAIGELDHATWAQAIERWFLEHMHEWHVRVRCELRVQVSATRFRVPDVVVWSREQPKQPILTDPPIAVFEVLSPEDSTSRLLIKLNDYESMGVRNIFVVDPKTGRTYRYVGGDLRICGAHVPLDGAEGHLQWDAISLLRDE